MITSVGKGNILESKAHTLVNTVNTVGIMGKGIAREFKRRFPDMYSDYVARCKRGEVKLGEPYLFRRLVPPWIINFPTKEHWRSVSRLDAIVAGLEFLEEHVQEWGIESLAVPPLGCGHGQLEWTVVGPTLYKHLDRLPVPVELFAPFDVPEEQSDPRYLQEAPIDTTHSKVPVEWLAVATAIARLAGEPYAWPVGHTRFQKLTYFAKAAGIPLPVRFEERPYGPFTPAAKKWLSRLVNNGLLREEHHGRLIRVLPGPTLEDAQRTYQNELQGLEDAIDRVVDLMMRLDSRQLEIAATIHFVTSALLQKLGRRPTEMEVVNEIKRWKRLRKPPPTESEIAEGVRNLGALGWVPTVTSEELPLDEETLSYA